MAELLCCEECAAAIGGGRGICLLAIEALEILALRPGATPVEIKEAYRDLVKVWHPDRFGSDARLRGKAEEKLRRINEAYRVLQSDADAVPSYRVKAESPTQGDVSSFRYSSYAPVAARSGRELNSVVMGWFFACAMVAVAILVVYLVIVLPSKLPEDATPAAASPPIAPGAAPGRRVRPAKAKSRVSGTGDSTVRTLSEAETARLEETCEPQRDRLGQGAYQVCVAAQSAVITNRAGPPDLSALNAGEHESIESTCAEAKVARGVEEYDRCLTVKLAEWAAEPARPNLSTLNEADRSSAELACRGARDAQGPAAYDRCLVQFIKALANSRERVPGG